MAWQLHNNGVVTPTMAAGRGSLRFQEMDKLRAHSTMLEADELIHRWLAGLETNASTGGDIAVAESAFLAGGGQNDNSDDFLSSVNWSTGDVGQSTKDILQGLLNKELKCESAPHMASNKSYNPLVSMEMRHKEVKRRRDDREKKRREKQERRKLSEFAEREARALVMEEERRARAKAAEEERMIEQQMKALRKEIRERERLTRQLVLEHSLISEEETMATPTRGGAVMEEAEQFIKSERQRVATRMELTRQLEEAELKETKENVKLLHQCFQSWWGEVMRGRGKLVKATAVRDWRLVLSVWKAWARFVKECREKKAREEIARWLQREKRMMEVAVEHHNYKVLVRSLEAWHRLTRQAKTERRQEEERLAYRAKMAALLQVAAAKAEKQRSNEKTHSPAKDHSPAHPWSVKAAQEGRATKQSSQVTESGEGTINRRHVDEEKGRSKDSSLQKKEASESIVSKGEKTASPKSLKNSHSSGRSSGPIWRNAKKQLDELLSQVDAPPITTPISPVGVAVTKVVTSNPPQSLQPKPKPPTKQLSAMTAAMEKRSAEIAERKLAREQRREARSREKAEQLACEEEEQRKAEAAVREAKLKQRREERRLVKQRELERLERQKILTEQNDKADHHYEMATLRWRGLAPWKRFVEEMKTKCHEADKMRERALIKKALWRWQRLTEQKERERESIALRHYHNSLLKRSLAAWIKFRALGYELEALADSHCPRFLMRRVFRGWFRTVRAERQLHWEKMARARRFRQRQVQLSVLRAWHAFVPLAKEEREKERRKAEMRRKVASWLDDYKPTSSALTNQQ